MERVKIRKIILTVLILVICFTPLAEFEMEVHKDITDFSMSEYGEVCSFKEHNSLYQSESNASYCISYARYSYDYLCTLLEVILITILLCCSYYIVRRKSFRFVSELKIRGTIIYIHKKDGSKSRKSVTI